MDISETFGAMPSNITVMNGTSTPRTSAETFAPEHWEWLKYFQRCSRLLVAIIEPMSLTLRYGNDYFCNLVGVSAETGVSRKNGGLDTVLNQMLSQADNQAVQQLYQRHLLHLVFRDFYQIEWQELRLLDQPIMLTIHSPLYAEPRLVEVWLRSDQLTITRINSTLDEFADLKLECMATADLERSLTDPHQLDQLEQRFRLDNYRVEGWLLLEGIDVTERETIHRITQLLIDQNSILQPTKFRLIDRQMRSLFQAQNTVVICIENKQTRLFTGGLNHEVDKSIYALEALQGSHFMQAVNTNRVLAVPDLAQDCRNQCGEQLVELGIRSMLLIPLIPHDSRTDELADNTAPSLTLYPQLSAPVVGVVALLSDRPHNFDALHCRYAEQLIPAFAAALTEAQRQLLQRRFMSNLHPAVEWRFLQEAERRSWGLPPEPIVFSHVYPLYGISDIRGSSDERNRAIQTDLLQQFKLGLAVVDAACNTQSAALCQQVRLDLLEHISQLQGKVTVDAEVSLMRYLQDNLEAYFDFFNQCGEEAIVAVNAYQNACQNDHGCVYQARAAYDETVNQINALLRQTWERWQIRMQEISPHYCDIEATDGIDHMIYAGQSIDPQFSNFHLRSLRYEQLRAICDCARTAFGLQDDYDTTMQVTHLVLVQDCTVDIFHDEKTERLFDVKGSRDTRYEIVKKRIDKAVDEKTQTRITQPGMLTIVYSTEDEWTEYQQYLRYLMREGWVDGLVEQGMVQTLQGVDGLKYARVQVTNPTPATPTSLDH